MSTARCTTHFHRALLSVALGFLSVMPVFGEKGRVLVPTVSGREGTTVLTGYTGWIDCFASGYGKSAIARIEEDGTFDLDAPANPSTLILMFDRMETPAIIVPRWPSEEGNFDVVIPVEYACVPEGPVSSWPENWIEQRVNVYQSFVARGTHLYGLAMFIRPQDNPEGNKYQMLLHAGGPETKALMLTGAVAPDPGWVNEFDRVAAEKNNHTLVRAGWRHGDMPVKPGETYTIRAEAYRTHGGKQMHLHSYIRPDNGDGYPHGRAYIEERPTDGDLCCLIFSDAGGQYIENQMRTEDWEIFLPGHRPTTDWGQTFVNHGQSLAGISFWAQSANDDQVMGEVRIREDGPWGKVIDPVKIFRSRPSPHRPRITYPDIPAPLPENKSYYESTPKLFQIAWAPDELPLAPGKTYYIEITPTKPLLMYADGHFYQHGHAYYEGLTVERQRVGTRIFHSTRWTLLMNIVTYARPGGEPLAGPRVMD